MRVFNCVSVCVCVCVCVLKMGRECGKKCFVQSFPHLSQYHVHFFQTLHTVCLSRQRWALLLPRPLLTQHTCLSHLPNLLIGGLPAPVTPSTTRETAHSPHSLVWPRITKDYNPHDSLRFHICPDSHFQVFLSVCISSCAYWSCISSCLLLVCLLVFPRYFWALEFWLPIFCVVWTLKSCFTFVFVPFFPLFPWLWLFPIKLHLPHVSVSPEVPDRFTDTHQRTSVNLWCKMHSNHQNTSYFTHCHN